jgi:hypothetical protein
VDVAVKFHPHHPETDMQSIEKLRYEANLYTTHPTPARQACAEALDILEACKAALTRVRSVMIEFHNYSESGPEIRMIDATLARI